MSIVQRQGFEMVPQAGGADHGAVGEIMPSRVQQEVQAAMIVAKKFPRDENAAYTRIMRACQRRSLAEVSQYSFPRGGTTVNGPSIRMAEVLAQNWGNLDFGIIELEQKPGESSMMAYCWDLETNTRQTKVFTVRHVRDTRQGQTRLTDARDIYEMTANQGARRLRACILGVIPGDVVEAAMDQCDKTLSSGNTEPLIDRVRKMAQAFAEIGVTTAMLEVRLGHRLDVTTEAELVSLRKVFGSIRDNMAPREQFFDVAAGVQRSEGGTKASAVAAEIKHRSAPSTPDVYDAPPPPPADEDVPTETLSDPAPPPPPVKQKPGRPAKASQEQYDGLVLQLVNRDSIDAATAKSRVDKFVAKMYPNGFTSSGAQMAAGMINNGGLKE